MFEVWTKAEHFARWFAPDGVEVPMCEMDAPEPAAAGIPAVVRHHKLAGMGWRQAVERLVEYLRSV